MLPTTNKKKGNDFDILGVGLVVDDSSAKYHGSHEGGGPTDGGCSTVNPWSQIHTKNHQGNPPFQVKKNKKDREILVTALFISICFVNFFWRRFEPKTRFALFF